MSENREEETKMKIKEDVSSPDSARARATMMNTDYALTIKTPVMLGKTVARVSLQRAVLLSTGMLAHTL